MPSVDFDLDDYTDEIMEEFCKCDCLRINPPKSVKDYIIELDKDLHIYLNPSKRTLEQVCYDLMQLIKE